LYQVEYAIEAVKLGSTSVAIQTTQGVVLAVEKRLTSPLLEPASVEKIMEVDTHIAVAVSGLIGDARTLVEHARIETQNHTFTYDEKMGVEALTQSVCDLALGFGESQKRDERKMSRPFGVALLLAGYDQKGPQLYFSDPSGTYLQYKAKAIGAGSEGAQSTLQDKYRDDMTLQEAEVLACEILKQVMEDKISNQNVEVATVTKEQGYHMYTAQEIDALIVRL
jgi:20S proteasome subunit alpha 5